MQKKLILSVLLLAPILIACGNTNGKTTPVYQGMVASDVSNDSTSLRASFSAGSINQDDPFLDDDEGTITDIINDTYSPTIMENSLEYFAPTNAFILITVKLSNPDNFIILSFILNEVFYQSYQFQDGSDSENLILKVNTGSVSGVKNFTIDAIKYIDGNQIKDAIFAGNKTIAIGVTHENVPTVEVTQVSQDFQSISFIVNFTDPQNSAIWTKAILYDGVSIIEEVSVNQGLNSINFTPLKTQTLYQIAVVGQFNILQGKQITNHLFHKYALRTETILDITNVAPERRAVQFDIDLRDVGQTGSIASISLLTSTKQIVTQSTNPQTRKFENLTTNTGYIIRVRYTFSFNNSLGDQVLLIDTPFTTLYLALDTNRYSLVGIHNGWNPEDNAVLMTRIPDDNLYEISLDLYRGDEWKFAANQNWDFSIAPLNEGVSVLENGVPWGENGGSLITLIDNGFAGGNFYTKVDGHYQISLESIGNNQFVIMITYLGLPLVEGLAPNYRLVGTFNNWSNADTPAQYIFSKINDNTYELNVELDLQTEFKIYVTTMRSSRWYSTQFLVSIAPTGNEITSNNDFNFIVKVSGNYNIRIVDDLIEVPEISITYLD